MSMNRELELRESIMDQYQIDGENLNHLLLHLRVTAYGKELSDLELLRLVKHSEHVSGLVNQFLSQIKKAA